MFYWINFQTLLYYYLYSTGLIFDQDQSTFAAIVITNCFQASLETAFPPIFYAYNMSGLFDFTLDLFG